MKKEVFLVILVILFIQITLAFCGDGTQEDKENCQNCPEDNPCTVYQDCIEKECVTKTIPPFFLKEDPSARILVPREIAFEFNKAFNEKTEQVFCLKGKYADGKYQITGLKTPKIIGQTGYEVIYRGCSSIGIIGTIHTHLDRNCEPSDWDIYSFGQKDDILTGIICGENNFAFYTAPLFKDKRDYLIMDIPAQEKHPLYLILPVIITGILSILLAFILYSKYLKLYKRNRELALRILQYFTQKERRILNILIEAGSINKANLSYSMLQKLKKHGIIKEKTKEISIKKWFRNALKSM